MSDVLVIGGGAVGCLTALELQRRGATVSLVERATLGAESSWAGGGILFPLLPWHYRDEVNALALAGASRYAMLAPALFETTGIDPEYHVSGMRVLPGFDQEKALTWCAANGIEAQLDGPELCLPHVAQARNPRLMRALKRQLEIDGVTVREGVSIASVEANSQKITSATTLDGEKLHADHVVITAGAWSQSLLGKHAAHIAVKPMRGQMLLYRLPPGQLREILYSEDFYLIPRLDGHLLAGSTVEDVGFDKSNTAEALQMLEQKAIALLPQLAGESPVKAWAGLRPGSPDNIPTIGRHPQLDNLWFNTGHFRYGVTMAPASAERLAALMARQPMQT